MFQTSVPNELEAIFRRGSGWDDGVELVLALAVQPGASSEDVREFLDLTQQLATSSAFGAVQAAAGPGVGTRSHGGTGDAADALPLPEFVMLVRFESKEQADEFARCPPMAAVLQGDARSPLRALWAAGLEIVPAENSNSSPQGGNRPLV